jgi:hypothetical protein
LNSHLLKRQLFLISRTSIPRPPWSFGRHIIFHFDSLYFFLFWSHCQKKRERKKFNLFLTPMGTDRVSFNQAITRSKNKNHAMNVPSSHGPSRAWVSCMLKKYNRLIRAAIFSRHPHIKYNSLSLSSMSFATIRNEMARSSVGLYLSVSNHWII